MTEKTNWRENLPDFLKPGNVETYAAPVDWNVACALQNVRAGVPLTEAQKSMLQERGNGLQEVQR